MLAEDKWGWVVKELEPRMKENANDDTHARTVYRKFQGNMGSLPVLGFNSAKYDLNLVKQKLAKHLRLDEQRFGFTIKKNNSYACISTDEFAFLDVSHFLAPGTSYSGFLKAYRVQPSKGFFPYEWFDDITKLDQTQLPSKECFYSSLKNEHISEQKLRVLSHYQAKSQYENVSIFLIWYNNQDVQPFVTAVERMNSFYFDKRIDVFKTAISAPGIARQLLFRTARNDGAEFSLFDKSNKDLYQTIKDTIVGGSSIIFTRHHKTDKTLIRDDKPCKRIVAYDANALYLWATGQSMP